MRSQGPILFTIYEARAEISNCGRKCLDSRLGYDEAWTIR